MKSSRRSSASSRSSSSPSSDIEPSSREIWLIGAAPHHHERIHLALRDAGGWTVREAPSVRRAVSRMRPDAVLIVPAAASSEVHSAPTRTRVLLTGSASALAVLDGVRFDDYLAEPWSVEELLYRLGRLVHRPAVATPSGSLEWRPYRVTAIGPGDRRAEAPVTPVQLELIEALFRGSAEPVPRVVLEGIVGAGAPSSRAVDMQISRLRRVLADVTSAWDSPLTIRTYRGRGYRLERG